MPDVVVLGAGVAGLTVAHHLGELGMRARVVAAERWDRVVSAAAGALWFPFRCDPPELVNRWAGRSRAWLMELAARDPSAGVDVLDLYESASTPERPWWAEAAGEIELLKSPRGPVPFTWKVRVPRCEPALFLPWLEARLPTPIETRRVASFDELDADVVVNCTGLAARALTGDSELKAVFGQTAIVEPGNIDLSESVEDDRTMERLFYSIPRRGTVVLGGCAEPSPDDRAPTPTPEMRAAILERAVAFGFAPGRLVRDSAGLRPYRSSVRLELDPRPTARGARVIHNYGHGGAGYTLARGCAEDVARLIRDQR